LFILEIAPDFGEQVFELLQFMRDKVPDGFINDLIPQRHELILELESLGGEDNLYGPSVLFISDTLYELFFLHPIHDTGDGRTIPGELSPQFTQEESVFHPEEHEHLKLGRSNTELLELVVQLLAYCPMYFPHHRADSIYLVLHGHHVY